VQNSIVTWPLLATEDNFMRLLFVGFAFPLPVNTGYKMRTWAVLESLAAAGHGITMLTFGDPEDARKQEPKLQRVCEEVEVIPSNQRRVSSTADYLSRACGIFSGQPFSVQRFVSSAMRARIERQLARNCYDALVCDSVYPAVNLPETRVPIVLNAHNVEHIVLQRYLPTERNPMKRFYVWSEMYKLQNWERRAGRLASMAMVCSENDQKLLGSLCPELRVNVVPNIVDMATYVPGPENDAATVLFPGAMDWFPNRDACSFFADRILPILRKGLPGVRFIVAGRNPPLEFRRRFSDAQDIEFTGEVPDMRAAIAAATVCVVPLRIGSGTRLKILEAGALAKSIVSTRVGAEGLDFVDGKEIMLADEPLQFAHAVLELLKDPIRRKTMGLAARARVEEQYGVPSLRAAIDLALSHLPARDRAAASATAFRPDRSPVHP
jgi:glycosyltransferase involved in cell wall biosynthesis